MIELRLRQAIKDIKLENIACLVLVSHENEVKRVLPEAYQPQTI